MKVKVSKLNKALKEHQLELVPADQGYILKAGTKLIGHLYKGQLYNYLIVKLPGIVLPLTLFNKHYVVVIYEMVNDPIRANKLKVGLHYLERIRQYSSDDVKTAVLISSALVDEPSYITYNQIVGDNRHQIVGTGRHQINHIKVHAEFILASYLDIYYKPINSYKTWVMDLEPCYDCLESILGVCKARPLTIIYFTNHKAKWNIPEYLELSENIRRQANPRYANVTYTQLNKEDYQ